MYFFLDKVEEYQFTRPIEVSISLLFAKALILTLELFFQEMKAIGNAKHGEVDLSSFLPGNAGSMLKMVDTMTNSGIMQKVT